MNRHNAIACLEQLASQKLITPDDDIYFWASALEVVLHDAEYDISQGKHCEVSIHLGVCSHWLRPHQTRWTADGGFAYAVGYGDAVFGCRGLPDFDWSVYLGRDQAQQWQILSGALARRTPRTLDLRVTFPARTERHQQAVVHTIWLPGTPKNPRQKRTRFYGFRRQENNWELKATMDYPDFEKEKI